MLLDPATFLQLHVTWEGEPLVLDGWQTAFVRRFARYRALTKSVQIGFSFICAAEALWMALMFEDETTTFISVNETDAREKVLYARKLYDGLDPEFLPYVPLTKDSTEELWIGPRERPSRIMTRPATSGLRGPATHVYLDEIEHYRPGQDTEVFTAAMGRVTRRFRRLTVGSSVFGEETMLARLMEPGAYPDFLKFSLPWTAAEKPDVIAGIAMQRRNMAPEDFSQEYECVRNGSGDSAFPQDLIRRCWHDEPPRDVTGLDSEATFVAGYDPGGSRHPAVLTVLDSSGGRWVQRVLRAKRGEPLAQQEAILDGLLRDNPGMRLAIDQAGVGLQMSQSLTSRWGRRVLPIVFTEATRNEMTLNLQHLMQDDSIAILRDSEQAFQLNRTRRLPGGKIEQGGSDRRHHYDKFWALAMAAVLVTGHRSAYSEHGLKVIDYGEEPRSYADHWTLDQGPFR